MRRGSSSSSRNPLPSSSGIDAWRTRPGEASCGSVHCLMHVRVQAAAGLAQSKGVARHERRCDEQAQLARQVHKVASLGHISVEGRCAR